MEVYVGKDEGRWPRGSRVRKVSSKPGDSHQDGAWGPLSARHRAELIIDLAKKGIDGDIECIY